MGLYYASISLHISIKSQGYLLAYEHPHSVQNKLVPLKKIRNGGKYFLLILGNSVYYSEPAEYTQEKEENRLFLQQG